MFIEGDLSASDDGKSEDIEIVEDIVIEEITEE